MSKITQTANQLRLPEEKLLGDWIACIPGFALKKYRQLFDALPYGKKICFVPFKSDLDSAWYVNRELSKQPYFTEVANDFAKAKIFYYDPFDMLLYGKKTQLIDM